MQLFNDFDCGDLIREIERIGAAVVPQFLSADTLAILLEELNDAEWYPIPQLVGLSDMDCVRAVGLPLRSACNIVACEASHALMESFGKSGVSPFSGSLDFNFAQALRYRAGSRGMGAHQDPERARNVVGIVVLEAGGRFRICDDVQGSNPVSVSHEAGDLILMRAPGFLGSFARPFHLVDLVMTQRTTIVLRQLA
ncbi:MAG: hypothetical protein JO019_04705 [Candidatus Kaiserbacteria bacterium]|nr:hypothetical protein [Candidatus Kaiserbacteria bacterium]